MRLAKSGGTHGFLQTADFGKPAAQRCVDQVIQNDA